MTDTTQLRPDAWQQDGPDRARLLATRCGQCATLTFPPLPACPSCWERDGLETQLLPERGVLHSFTIVHTPSTGIAAPYAVGLVDYEGGVRVCGRLRGGDDLEAGIPVETVPGTLREGTETLTGWIFQPVADTAESS
ncbi:Zn-ribbon domain-containing OB-fold protein [Nocardia asteroides]|uniref:Zn-ribbon domain-containing OB-fold protein n=1 Tax=Nocardia asteroides TaxID=1824 RepID=UPI003418FE8B